MNIVRALEVALPELPERIIRNIPPKLDPRVVYKDHIENGEEVVLAKMPGSELVFRFAAVQWQLIRLFDGNRSPADVAELFAKETGTAVSEDEVKELASYLQSDTPMMYKTPLEKNITLQQELRASREKRRKSRAIDFSDIIIKTWYNADGYITWLYPRLRFLFTPWFVWTSVAMFILMGWMWWDRFGEVWSDSFAFYNFTQKSGSDLLEFWFLFGAMAAIHETAHGLVGKHFGATIERMGFTLMYFAPSFFCDATQVWVLGGKWPRIATALAGIWLDLVVCFFATVVWWGTATGMPVHDWAYKIMMVTGLGVSILNLNPLIKLDGYLIFSEFVAEPSLKESSTEYLSGWLRNRIFRLPVEVPYVPRRKRGFYIIYGILSGMYSYVLLSFLMIITYHILRSYTPDWAFLPALAIGFWVFRSRIKLLVKFMKIVYADKKERVRAWFTPLRSAALGAAVLLVLLVPVWPDFVEAPVLLEPLQTAIVRATVPGTVEGVAVQESQSVAAGSPLLRMRNLALQSQAAEARQELAQATARANQAALHYANFASAEQERRRRAEENVVVADQLAQLDIASPMRGVVATPHLHDLVGRSVDEGDLLMQIDDISEIKANIYIPEFAMRDVHVGQSVRLLIKGRVRPISGTLSRISPVSTLMAEGLVTKDQLEGINPPQYYSGVVMLANDGALMPGMTGSAKVLVGRRSLEEFTYRFSRDLVKRRIW
ncbi:MAG TPA: HlyD family efflux transporter periplasmic adaptor subunit [Terriglobales bacterium]|nr:HlyD family efflux transporter periplasmic adaptor subunit [Terriglobales bacterium]